MRQKSPSFKVHLLILSVIALTRLVTITQSVTIDSQVTVIKNDCFERQAIGYRLKPSDIYKTIDVKTVPECQRECTIEEDTCKTFSFGIGVKGNTSCQLSKKVIPETADLKPIGIIIDDDFDLYIKKLGCKLVIKQKPATPIPQSDEIPSGTFDINKNKPNTNSNQFSSYGSDLNDGGSIYASTSKPQTPSKVKTFQTSLISIRPDPSRPGYTGLSPALAATSNSGSSGYGQPDRPVNEPLSERPNYENDRPRPSYSFYGSVTNSYVNEIPRPIYEDMSRPGGLYQGQSSYNSYGNGGSSYQDGTYNNNDSYDLEGYDAYGPARPYKPTFKPPRNPIDNEVYYNRPELNRPDFRPGVGHYRPIDYIVDELKPNFDNLRPESWSDPIASYEYGMNSHEPFEAKPVRPSFDEPRPLYESKPESDRPKRPLRPDFTRPSRPTVYYRPSYDNRLSRPVSVYGSPAMEFSRPGRPQYDYGNGMDSAVPPNFRPEIRPYNRPNQPERPDIPIKPVGPDGGYGQRPSDFRPSSDHQEDRPDPELNRPHSIEGYDSPERPFSRPKKPPPQFNRPANSFEESNQFRPNWDKDIINRPYDSNNPNVNYGNVVKSVIEESNYGNRRHDNSDGIYHQRNNTEYSHSGGNIGSNSESIISQSIGPYGEKITSIITEIKTACFRRALAGKRVSRSLVRRALSCGRVEDCQQECQDEKRFVCEGFNYRLDPTGRNNGDCELLDLPMIRVDMRRDIYPDPDYDIYEKDRNGYPDCKGGGFGFGFGDRHRDHNSNRDYIRDRDNERNQYADRRYDSIQQRPLDYYRYHNRHENRYDDRRRPSGGGYLPGNRREDDNYSHGHSHYGGGAGDFQTHNHNNYGFNIYRNSPSYLPDRRPAQDRNHWGLAGSNSWGSYGNGHTYSSGSGIPSPYDIPLGDSYAPKPGYDLLPKQPSYLPGNKGATTGYDPENGGVYGNAYGGLYGGATYGSTRPAFGIVIPINSNNFGQPKLTGYGPSGDESEQTGYKYPNVPITEEHFPVTSGNTVEHKDGNSIHSGYNFLKEECSLRTATGFRLHKIIVKKYYSVPDIYECETLCFKEKDFQCQSYAYRYTLTSTVPTDNCYLSERNYKQLDFYTDLEPDRDFDIYTMNNRKKCEEQIPLEKEHSDCFWHTRSGQRLDQKIIREATMVKSIVECQIACLRSTIFLCRGFSFRYGSAVIGGPVENCLLTDWPFKEIDPNTQFASELGFEIYERGSFGHGCEPNHFAVRGKESTIIGAETDQLCYVGYGTPARLHQSAIRKSLTVDSELECKTECTKYRQSSLISCMSFSYKTKPRRGEANCDLSDILQRDLLHNIDYIPDKQSWLFAWDHYNADCVRISNTISPGSHGGQGGNQYVPHRSPTGYSYRHGLSNKGGYGSGFSGSHTLEYSRGHANGLITLRPHPHDGPHGYHAHDHDYRKNDLFDLKKYDGPITALDTWRVYSVSGWPCRRGSLCRENKDAGFWYCDLEGGDRSTWDYCCRPDHQCGYSEGYNYQWCYVGPERTQWRKCSERYYPYPTQQRADDPKLYIPSYNPDYESPPPHADRFLTFNAPQPPPFRPNRPIQRPRIPPNMPSLNEYESEFNRQFLDPPKPGGLGAPRYWPVSYLHKELPPEAGNATEFKYDRIQDGRIKAIHNLITIIKSNTLRDIKYEINNDTNLLIHLPLPGNITQKAKLNKSSESKSSDLERPKISDKTNSKLSTTAPAQKDNTTKIMAEKSTDQIDAASEGVSGQNKSVKSRNIHEHELKYSKIDSPESLRTGRLRQFTIQDITKLSKYHISTASSRQSQDEVTPLTVPTYKKSYIVRTNKTDRALNISF